MAALRLNNRPTTSLSILFWFLILTILFISGHCVNLGCQEVKSAYKLKGFDDSEVPIQAISGEYLEVCPQGYTCCTKRMEDALYEKSTGEYEVALNNAIALTQKLFATRTAKFDRFFVELLENAKTDLHEMFVRTYGLIYQQHSQVFMDLFTDLRGYYKGRNINLMEALENFFVRLLKKMFPLLNTRFSFTEDYLNCVVENMNDLQPFGDVPQKLKKEVRRAFVAARTFVQGLAIGRDVVDAVTDIPPTLECKRALMKMMYCPHCRGLTHTKPCNNLCLNTMKGCLAYHAELNKAWNLYIDALKLLAERLEGPFNIESVVDPIDVKISDAIMNFQENDREVSKKIFAGCGKPEMRKKRSVDEKGDNSTGVPVAETKTDYVDPAGSPYRYKPSNTGNRPITAAGTNLDRLVIDIKRKIELVKDFWVDLPFTVCNNETLSAQPNDDDNCWNGQDKAKYVPAVQQDGVLNQVNNPEVDVDVTKANSMIVVQIRQLTLITDKLHNAYLGHDVDWVDIELDSELSGSGSGSGSGMEPDEPETKSTDQYYFVRNTQPTVTSRRPRPSTPRSYTTPDSSSRQLVSSSVVVVLVTVVTCWLQRSQYH